MGGRELLVRCRSREGRTTTDGEGTFAMSTSATAQSGVQVLAVEGELVTATAGQFRTIAKRLLERAEGDYVVDFESTTAVDSAGLESLTWLSRECEERLGAVKLCNLSPALRTVLRITRLADRFECFENTDAAVASFG
jgi:anti-anti-sigma factor